MNVEWPAVEPGILSFLQSTFRTPLRLDAAFDGNEDGSDLLAEAFPDMLDEERLGNVAILLQWKVDMVRPLKRVRRATVDDAMHVLPLPSTLNVQDEYVRITKTSAHCILEMFTKRKQKKYREDPADARSKRFET